MTQVLAHAVWDLLPAGQGIHVRVTTANAGWAGSPAKAAWQLRQKHLKYGPTRQQLEVLACRKVDTGSGARRTAAARAVERHFRGVAAPAFQVATSDDVTQDQANSPCRCETGWPMWSRKAGCPMKASDEDLLELVQAVLDGRETYRSAASKVGVVRSTIERRVKGLVRRLFAGGLLGSFREEWIDDIATLRRERAAILAAARLFTGAVAGGSVAVPGESELAQAAKRLREKGGTGHRDAALICVLFDTGMKTIELARLEVADYLAEDGSVRVVSNLRAAIAVNGVERPLHFNSQLVVESIDAYLVERARRMQGLGERARYRGLDPQSRLFLTDSGQPFLIKARSPSDPRPTCKYLQATLRQAFARAGWPGMTASRLRRHVAVAMNQQGATRGEVQAMLGLKAKRSVKRLTSTWPAPADSRMAHSE